MIAAAVEVEAEVLGAGAGVLDSAAAEVEVPEADLPRDTLRSNLFPRANEVKDQVSYTFFLWAHKVEV